MKSGVVVGLAASLLVSGAAVLGASTPADAASGACKDNTAVTVVVDFNGLGGGVDVDCVAGGQAATDQFRSAGHTVEMVTSQPGMVCRIDGAPTDQPSNCHNSPPTNAYWSLWWADGKGGDWVYSSLGATSLKVPTGAYVAFSWNTGGDEDEPSYDPVPLPAPSASASSSPSKSPTKSPTKSTGPGPGNPSSGAPTRSASGTASSGDTAGTSDGTDSSGATSTDPAANGSASTEPASDDATSTDSASDDDASTGSQDPSAGTSADDSTGSTTEDLTVGPQAETTADEPGLPGWVPPVILGGLLIGIGAVVVVRRRALAAAGHDTPSGLDGP